MSDTRKYWWLWGATFALPYLALMLAGSIWLWERGWLLAFTGVAAMLSLASWAWLRWRGPHTWQSLRGAAAPDANWAEASRLAWEDVERVAQEVERSNPAIERPEQMWTILQPVLETVAARFHPESSRALLETPLPHLFRVLELVARDLAVATGEHVPGAHLLTVNDVARLGRAAQWSSRLYVVYKILAFGLDPIGGLTRQLRDSLSGKLLESSTTAIKGWALGLAVRRAGYYAIQLYSGQLLLHPEEFQKYVTPKTRDDLDEAAKREQQAAGEMLRMLVLGQLKAGKSSLVNALFGEVRAATDVLPLTPGVTPYLLTREGIDQALVLDTAGYADPAARRSVEGALATELEACDLIVVVCSATSAARAADRQLLDNLRSFFAAHPDRSLPPVVAALTHIDQLRPMAEWSPPYDLTRPAGAKAEQIAAAVAAVAEDLALSTDAVVPVCLAPGRVYNVEEALIPAILEALPESRRARYLRCLREYRTAENWRQLRRQAVNSGRLLVRKVFGP